MTARVPTVALALLAGLHALLFLGAGPIDDDFIVHRYARNLLRGDGLVFNPGSEPVEGFTAPLWLAVSVLLQVLGVAVAEGTRAVGVLAHVGLVVVLARAPLGRAATAAAALAAASPALAYHACAGLGTSLLGLLLGLWAVLWVRADAARRAPLGAGLALAAACLVRQEAALLWAPFALVCARERHLAAALPGVVALVGWTLARLAAFGAWLPNTWAIKRLPLAEDLGYGWRYLGYATEHGMVAPLLIGTGLALLDRRLAQPLRWVAGGVLLHALYVVRVGGDWMPFARFFAPTLPLMMLVTCATLWARLRPRIAVGLALGLALLLQVGQRENGIIQQEHAFFEERWGALGEYFGAHVPAGEQVALSPVGHFGWTSDLPLIDLLGLTHTAFNDRPPDLQRVALKGHHRFDGGWVLDQRPGYVLLGNGVLQPSSGKLEVNPWELDLVLDPRFPRDYRHVRAEVDGEPVEYFRRFDAPPLPGERARRGPSGGTAPK